MKKMMDKVFKHYEDHFPEDENLLKLLAVDSKDKEGNIEPVRGPALNTSYFLDGDSNRRPMHQEAFDKKLSKEEKDLLNKEALDMGELSLMLYHPGFVIDPSSGEEMSDNRKVAKDVFEHLIDVYGETAAEKSLEELVSPLHELLKDEVFDEEKALNSLLPYVMTEDTEHDPEDYKKVFMNHFLLPAIQGHHLSHWPLGVKEYIALKEKFQ